MERRRMAGIKNTNLKELDLNWIGASILGVHHIKYRMIVTSVITVSETTATIATYEGRVLLILYRACFLPNQIEYFDDFVQ